MTARDASNATQPRVRRAGPADAGIIARLRRAWTEEYAARSVEDPSFDSTFAEWYEQESRQRVNWLAELTGEPVGMLNLLVFTRMPRPVDAASPESRRQWGYVANVYVHPSVRRRGAGSALVAAAVRYAEDAGFARLVLSPSEQSVPLYRAFGFVPATSLMIREET